MDLWLSYYLVQNKDCYVLEKLQKMKFYISQLISYSKTKKIHVKT